MPSNEYEFVTRWRVPGTTAAVYDILIQGVEYSRWWPQVYLEVVETCAGGEHGLGKAGRLLTKGKLPYTLRWQMRVVETRYPLGFTIEATGDFIGRGIWTFDQEEGTVIVTFDWRLRAEKSLLRYLSFIFKPIFRANHRWAMARGEESLKAELVRQEGTSLTRRRA